MKINGKPVKEMKALDGSVYYVPISEEEIDKNLPPVVLPPLPWDWVAAGKATNNGRFHAYLVDATGRKIAAIWGKEKEKELIADTILKAVNAYTAGK